ncbi:hypothetical protein R3P38DRAFT_2915545 [Favolaschia claudopus]|uniref:BTB domain-containing protein n=1 Tax=Favolaschia claudopus TaxID=2862362 RepID=A0AAW0C2R8_9AGAR
MSPPTTTTSPRFNCSSADLTIRSSDGVLFHLHRSILQSASAVFADAAAAAGPLSQSQSNVIDDIVDLTEPADILDLLFRFVYAASSSFPSTSSSPSSSSHSHQQPTEQEEVEITAPDLSSLPFPTLSALAECAHKYIVYPALTACTPHMHQAAATHPLPVLLFALRHRHIALANEAAAQSMRFSPAHARAVLSAHNQIMCDWEDYYERWHLATAQSLAYLASPTFPQHAELVARCLADPAGNPICTYARELDKAGGWARRVREEVKFVVDERVRRLHIQCNTTTLRNPSSPLDSSSPPVSPSFPSPTFSPGSPAFSPASPPSASLLSFSPTTSAGLVSPMRAGVAVGFAF